MDLNHKANLELVGFAKKRFDVIWITNFGNMYSAMDRSHMHPKTVSGFILLLKLRTLDMIQN